MIATMAHSSISLLPDRTLIFQLAIFFFVLMVVNVLVIRPTLKVLRRRRERTVGDEARAAELEAKAVATSVALEEEVASARRQVLSEEEAKRRAVTTEAARLVAEARQRARNQVDEGRERLATLTGRTQMEVTEAIPELADLIFKRVTGQNGKEGT